MVVVLVGHLMTVRNYCSEASEVDYSTLDSIVVVIVGEAVDATVAVAAVVVVAVVFEVVFAVAVVALPSVA